MAAFVAPMLLATGAPRDTTGWVVQPKLDGWRVQLLVDERGVTVWSRNGVRLRVPELDELALRLGARRAHLDGELVVMDGPVADFRALGDRMRRGPEASPHRASLVAFDLLAVDGRTLAAERWDVRQRALAELGLRGAAATMPVFHDVDAAWRTAREQRWEGVVYKRVASRWRTGERSPDWRKRKVWRTSEFVVTGYRLTGGRLDAVALARPDAPDEPVVAVDRFARGASSAALQVVLSASVATPVQDDWRVVPPVVRVAVQHRTGPSGDLREPLVVAVRPG